MLLDTTAISFQRIFFSFNFLLLFIGKFQIDLFCAVNGKSKTKIDEQRAKKVPKCTKSLRSSKSDLSESNK